jgi:hypothetical protein
MGELSNEMQSLGAGYRAESGTAKKYERIELTEGSHD